MLFAFCKIPTVVVPLLVVFTPPQRISQKENIPPRLPLAGCRPRRISRMHSLNTSSTFSPLYALVSMYFALYRSAMDAPVSEETISLLLFTKSFLLSQVSKQFSSSNKFHYEKYFGVSMENVFHTHKERMIRLL